MILEYSIDLDNKAYISLNEIPKHSYIEISNYNSVSRLFLKRFESCKGV